MSTIDPRAFRDALGEFPTGVTIVTTRDGNGQPIGVTASSFNSVSLDPPLVLWSIARTARSHDIFTDNGYFAIHVLEASQTSLSDRFARAGENKFADLDCVDGFGAVPLLPDCRARFQCRLENCYDGGDHSIMVGRVLAFDRPGTAINAPSPLIFYRGQYASLGAA
jgi:3-hydroxy-9,10-secoandrosta-1,3,5(10)-triene-9,17-dione monooxygenase reductase component